ncbi:MAG: HepT-like ribonuclease domain-containing protein, partial [Candidatus Micrarchaeota archaeon]
AFEILLSAGAISRKTCEALKQAKSMRNRIVHNYGDVKNEIVFNALNEELPRDIENLISEIEKYLENRK